MEAVSLRVFAYKYVGQKRFSGVAKVMGVVGSAFGCTPPRTSEKAAEMGVEPILLWLMAHKRAV